MLKHNLKDCISVPSGLNFQIGEFDPGSERTLAAWIRHASRTICCNAESGKRVSNTWVICLRARNNFAKARLIPDKTTLMI